MQSMEGCMLLYFVKSKNIFILLYFLRFQEGGYSPPSHPPKSATGILLESQSVLCKSILINYL